MSSSDILERYKVLKCVSIPSPLNSEKNTSLPMLSTVASSSSSSNPPKTRHVVTGRRSRRTQSRIQYFGRKRKFSSRFQSTEQQHRQQQQQRTNEVCRRSSSRLASLSIISTESTNHYVDNHNSSTSGGGSDEVKSPRLRNRFNVMQEEKLLTSTSSQPPSPPPSRNTTLTRSGCFFLLRSWLTRSLSMIKTLSSNPRSLFFLKPVNSFKYPRYHEIMHENPMDLSIIQQRLITARIKLNASKQRFLRGQLQCEYTPDDMLNDLKLIMSNAKQCYSVDRENEMLHDDIIWLESWINDVAKPYLSNILNSLISFKSQNIYVNNNRRSYTPCHSTTNNNFKRSLMNNSNRRSRRGRRRNNSIRRSINLSRDEKNAEITGEEFSPSRGIASSSLTTQSGAIRTSSGRVVKPPPRDSSQEFSLSLSDEYDTRSDCSHDKRKRTTIRSHPRRLKTPSCSSSNTLPCRNQLHSSTRRYAKRGRPPRVGVVCSPSESVLPYTSSLEDVSNNTLRRSTRKRRMITSYDGLDEIEDWE
ncbi:unnamed protein product [Trichobilharzia regenti]|nr:unnamed protein product [Trichobilharzia regenti]